MTTIPVVNDTTPPGTTPPRRDPDVLAAARRAYRGAERARAKYDDMLEARDSMIVMAMDNGWTSPEIAAAFGDGLKDHNIRQMIYRRRK